MAIDTSNYYNLHLLNSKDEDDINFNDEKDELIFIEEQPFVSNVNFDEKEFQAILNNKYDSFQIKPLHTDEEWQTFDKEREIYDKLDEIWAKEMKVKTAFLENGGYESDFSDDEEYV